MATNSNYFLLPLGAGLLLFTAYLIVNETIRWRARVKGIGGPRGLPLVGNIPQVYLLFSYGIRSTDTPALYHSVLTE